ncbi:MAG TPA: transposase [Gemmataceae bacterium]|nr:transposase [Gemmataceae bacterium]
MNAREERGLIIAALCKLKNDNDGQWVVPSQSGGDRLYRVNPMAGTCTCPDHQETGFKCKHVYAVEFTMKRETKPDGTVIETKSVTFTEKKVYKQDWPAYNVAQATEKRRFQVLSQELCRTVTEPELPPQRGPKPHTYRDSLFAMVFKVYVGFSARRFETDLHEAHERGHTSRPIPGMKVTSFHENEAFTPILMELIARSAAPLASVETEFAVDSSGFSNSKFERWFDEKYGVTKRTCQWVKVHCAVGVKTNVVTAVRILEQHTGDAPQFKPLVQETAKRFTVNEVSGDKAYTSNENFEAVADVGGTGYLAFKANTRGGVGGLFEKMFHYFQFQKEEYTAHYHKRSNVESSFSAIKRVFGDSVRSKTDAAMKNEVLCKILAHNLCCLIHEQEKLGIAPIFWKDEQIHAVAV